LSFFKKPSKAFLWVNITLALAVCQPAHRQAENRGDHPGPEKNNRQKSRGMDKIFL